VLNWPASWASTLRAFDPMRRLRSWTLLLLIPLLVSCSPSPRASVVTGCADAQAACLQGLATVTMQTSQGEFTIEVNGDAAPLTSGNFIDLVRRGTYDGTMFHRVVREPVPFVVQGGDPQSSDRSVPLGQLGTGSFVDPDNGQARMIPLEIKFRSEPQPRYSRRLRPAPRPPCRCGRSRECQRGPSTVQGPPAFRDPPPLPVSGLHRPRPQPWP